VTRRPSAVAATLVALVVSLLGALVAAPPPAGAIDATASVTILLDSMTPVVATADGTLRIEGRVVNSSNVTLTSVHVELRRSSAPLTTRQDVETIAKADLTPTTGSPDDLGLAKTHQALADSLPPGERRPFTITIPFAEMGMSTPGTYALGIEVTGRASGVDALDVRKGDFRTFLPWFPQPDSVKPIDVVWLWPLSDWPARTASGVLLNNRTPVEISPGGRLDRIVEIGSRFSGTLSWIVDPALLQTAFDMSRGYQVLQGNTLTLGDRQDAARDWLGRVRGATTPGNVRSIPYADIDAAAVVRGGMSNDVVRAVTQGPGIAAAALKTPAPGGMYWAPVGRLDRSTTNVLASAGVTTMILSNRALPPTDATKSSDGFATAALPTSVGTLQAVLSDADLTDLLSKPQRTPSDIIAIRQQFLAQTALMATSLPTDQVSRSVVVAPASVRWDPTANLLLPLLRATRSAPWLSPMPLGRLLDAPVSSTSRQRGGYGPKAKAAELPPSYMARVRRATKQLDAFTAIVDDPTGLSEPFSAALVRTESAAWRTNLETGQQLLSQTADELGQRMASVRVLSTGTITFSGDTGRVPVTIANDLDRSVTVGLALQGNPALRLSSAPLANIQIQPGKMASVDIDARVIGGDPLTVDVQLLTPDLAPYGRPATIQLVSTAYSRAAAWVVAAAFVAILVFVVVGVTRRIHKARTARPDDAPVGP
jgi:hypothetical protein